MAEENKAVKTKGSFTLKVNGDIYDNMTHTTYKSGDVVEEITPFLQLQINEGLVSII